MPQVTLSGDGSRLRQVVTNIVGNIHRYTPADSPVEVSMGVLPASISPESLSRMPATEASMRHLIEAVEVGQNMQVGMNYAFVRFSDHGPGVPEASRSQIFERFYTADPSRARQKGGTGLGMAIALSVVKAHRGFICASGSDGGGLTLTVVLPIAPVEPQAAGSPMAAGLPHPYVHGQAGGSGMAGAAGATGVPGMSGVSGGIASGLTGMSSKVRAAAKPDKKSRAR